MFDLRLLMSVLLVMASVQDMSSAEYSRSCEGRNLHLSCGIGKTIIIIEANYGRTAGGEVCPHPSIHDLDCHASCSLDILRVQCDGMSSCAVPATNEFFGDPCVGTYKYLEVKYVCKHGPEKQQVCEGSNLQLSCGSGKTINIIEVNYGRTTGGEVCPHSSIQDLDCHAPYSSDIMRAECDGESSCAVPATNEVFGEPCVGTYKYLNVTYDCNDGHSRACEGSDVQLNCGSGRTIIILGANYGRTTGGDVCPHPSIHDLDCHASNSLDTLSAECNGVRSCKVPATNGVFGDPCPGTYKYLDVTYDCY